MCLFPSHTHTHTHTHSASDIDEVCVEAVPCTILNMGFFDRLTTGQIVRESGSIRKCFDEVCNDIVISDELRKLLLVEDSDNYCLYNEEERDELLFKILKHVALGGPVNQVFIVDHLLIRMCMWFLTVIIYLSTV